MFEIIAEDKKTRARTGLLKTAHGKLETPFFMPVATKGAVKYVSADDLKKIGAFCIISNSFVLYLKPGLDVISHSGGLHKFMKWNRGIFTDSGGFQCCRESFFVKSTAEGLHLKSPFDGRAHLLTPEKSMEIQQTIGSDIAMCLDDMPSFSRDKKYVAEKTKTTHEWAERCLAAHTDKKQLLFGIAQGGVYADLRKKSMKFISSHEFDGIALGGLAIGEPLSNMHDMITATIEIAPRDKPRYLMGVGSPEDIFKCITLGVDCFDSTFPTQNARHNTLFTHKGKIKIFKGRYKHDLKPIDEECDCPVCAKYTRSYIHHLKRMEEPLGMMLATVHNLAFITNFMKDIRTSLKEGRFYKFQKEFLESFKKRD
jgi:queuine tRNA-ribosyltransferase